MIMGADEEALNAELVRRTIELGSARQRCRDSRPGVADPAVALRELGRVQQEASAFWDERSTDLARADQLVLLDFLRAVALAATQFLEYGQQLPQLPDPHSDDWLDAEASRGLRLSQGRVVVNVTRTLALSQLPGFVRLELKGAVLRSALHALPELEPVLPVLARELLKECDTVEASGEPDPVDMIPFTRVTALSTLAARDPTARQQFLTLDPESLHDPLAAWDLVIGQVAWSGSAADAQARATILHRFTAAVDWALTDQSPPQRLARRATAEQQVLGAVADLAGTDVAAAVHLLDDLGRLCGFSAPGPGTLHLFAASGVLHGVLRSDDPHECTVVAHPVPESQWSRIVQAAVDGREEDALPLIRRAAKPLLRDSSLASATSVELDPSSLLSWWPWHIVHTGGGPLGANNDVRWRTRARDHATNAADPTSVLIVDTSFRQADSVVAGWNRHVGGRVLRYDSEKPGSAGADLRRQVLEVLSTHGDVTYFGHAVSDPLSVDESGLVLSEDLLISLADLEALDTPPASVTLVACESGRSNLMLAGVSPAHSLAAAGVRQVIGTLWPISARLGLDYLQTLFAVRGSGPDLEQAWRQISRTKKDSVAAFMIMTTTDR